MKIKYLTEKYFNDVASSKERKSKEDVMNSVSSIAKSNLIKEILTPDFILDLEDFIKDLLKDITYNADYNAPIPNIIKKEFVWRPSFYSAAVKRTGVTQLEIPWSEDIISIPIEFIENNKLYNLGYELFNPYDSIGFGFNFQANETEIKEENKKISIILKYYFTWDRDLIKLINLLINYKKVDYNFSIDKNYISVDKFISFNGDDVRFNKLPGIYDSLKYFINNTDLEVEDFLFTDRYAKDIKKVLYKTLLTTENIKELNREKEILEEELSRQLGVPISITVLGQIRQLVPDRETIDLTKLPNESVTESYFNNVQSNTSKKSKEEVMKNISNTLIKSNIKKLCGDEPDLFLSQFEKTVNNFLNAVYWYNYSKDDPYREMVVENSNKFKRLYTESLFSFHKPEIKHISYQDFMNEVQKYEYLMSIFPDEIKSIPNKYKRFVHFRIINFVSNTSFKGEICNDKLTLKIQCFLSAFGLFTDTMNAIKVLGNRGEIEVDLTNAEKLISQLDPRAVNYDQKRLIYTICNIVKNNNISTEKFLNLDYECLEFAKMIFLTQDFVNNLQKERIQLENFMEQVFNVPISIDLYLTDNRNNYIKA